MKSSSLHRTWTVARIRLDTPPVRAILLTLSVAVLLLGVARQVRPSSYSNPADSDFLTYYNAALVIRHGGNPYVPAMEWIRSFTPRGPFLVEFFVYTPFFALLVMPLTIFPYAVANVLWGLCNLFCLVGSIYCILRLAGRRPAALEVCGFAAAASLLDVVRLEFYWGQADLFLLFFVSSALLAGASHKPILAGLLLSVACVTKPQMLVILPFLLWKREIWLCVTAILSFLTLLLAPFLWLGSGALYDQVAIWQFWSSQFVAFKDNEGPKGILVRLFTVNPEVRPLVVAPWLVNVFWLIVVAGLVVVTLACTSRVRLRRDVRTLLEIGIMISVVLLVSPLTEYIYTTVLLLPFLSLYALVREGKINRSQARLIAIGVAITWAWLCLPLEHVEVFMFDKMKTSSLVADLLVLCALPFLYAQIAIFALQLRALCYRSSQSVHERLRVFLTEIVKGGATAARAIDAYIRV